MKRSTIAGGLLVVAGAVLFARTLVRGREPSARATETAERPTAARIELEEAPALAPMEPAHREALAPSRPDRRRPTASARWLTIDVSIPPGLPPADEPAVLVQFAAEDDAFDGWLRSVSERLDRPGTSARWLMLPGAAPTESGVRRTIPPDGQVHVAVPDEARCALFLVQSRFLFLEPRLVA